MIKHLVANNPAVSSLAGFFIFIFSVQYYADSQYKVSYPIVFADTFTPTEQAQIRESLKWQLLAWQSDFTRASNQADKVIVKRDYFKNNKGELLSGLCRERTITVYAGKYLELPSFYHELCHLNEDSGNEHSDPRWSKWEARNRELCLFLIRARHPSVANLQYVASK